MALPTARSNRAARRRAAEDLDRWLESLARDINHSDGTPLAAAAIPHTATGTAHAARAAQQLAITTHRQPPLDRVPPQITRARDRRARGLTITLASVLAATTLEELAVRCEHLAFVANDLSDITPPMATLKACRLGR
jgi:hypothetical protein